MSKPGAALAAGVAVVIAALAVGLVLSVHDTVQILNALQGYIWPIVVAAVLLRLTPTINEAIRSRRIDLEVAGVKISLQEALVQLPRQIDDLRRQVVGERGADTAELEVSAGRILWVDDRPTANVFEKAALENDGWKITSVESTDAAIAVADGKWDSYDVVVSDMRRDEGGTMVPDAGLALAKYIRASGANVRIYIYTGQEGRVVLRRSQAIENGLITDATSNSASLLSLIRFGRKV